jgi:hypothetical protein
VGQSRVKNIGLRTYLLFVVEKDREVVFWFKRRNGVLVEIQRKDRSGVGFSIRFELRAEGKPRSREKRYIPLFFLKSFSLEPK